jgi:hypothetical protein
VHGDGTVEYYSGTVIRIPIDLDVSRDGHRLHLLHELLCTIITKAAGGIQLTGLPSPLEPLWAEPDLPLLEDHASS